MIAIDCRSVLDGSNVLQIVSDLAAVGDIIQNINEVLEIVAVLISAAIQEIEHGCAVFIFEFVEAV